MLSEWRSFLFAGLIVLGTVAVACAGQYSLAQYLSIQYADNPSFSPSADQVVYRTNISGVPQIWRIPSTGGYQTQLTFDTNGVDGVWWSPEHVDRMIIAADVGGNERTQFYLLNVLNWDYRRITTDDQAIHNFGVWSHDGSRFAYATNSRNGKDFDIYEYHFDHNDAYEIYRGEGTNAASSYSPDNRYLLIVREWSSSNQDLLLYDRELMRTRVLTSHTGNIVYEKPVWDPSGKGFYLLSNMGREFTGLAYWPLDSSAFRWVATPDWDVELFTVSPDGNTLVWVVNEAGYSRFNLRNLKTGRELPSFRFPRGVITEVEFSQDSRKIALVFGSGARPFDVWVYDVVADNLMQITFSATGGIPLRELREPTLIHYDTFDTCRIPAFWYMPAKPEPKMPVLVMIHGGPESQARPDMSGLIQYFVSRGYGVLEPNIRGSSGYGKTYMAMDDVRGRMDAVRDIEYGARWLAARSDVDSKRLAIYGGSYGGFAVLSSLTTYPHTWAVGASVVGIANFVSFLQNTGIYRRALREAEYGSLENDREFLTQISPLTHVDKIKAPLFLVQGANDPRVPKSEADQMAEAIRARGGVVEYLLFEDEGHGLSKTHNRIKAYSAMADFFDRHLKGKGR